MKFDLTPDSIVVVLGAIVSLIFTYFPKLNTWFAGLEADIKSLIMILLMVVIEGAVFVLSCILGVITSNIACASGFWNILFNMGVTLVLAIMSNQSVFSITKNLAPKKVKQLKLPTQAVG